jgi:hypothetical protein
MEKLNQYAPYILIICGGLISLLNFTSQTDHTKGYIGLIFIGFGGLILFMKNKGKA